jgi:hypothetical protein
VLLEHAMPMMVTAAERGPAPGARAGQPPLDPVAAAVARVWQARERAEREASRHFALLAGALASAGFPESVWQMALQAARDESEHATLCRRVVAAHAPSLPSQAPRDGIRLGPATLAGEQRALYQAVALSCVTETLSVGLLLEMRACVRDPAAMAAVSRIVRDESRHSQIGWAALRSAQRSGRPLSWLTPHIGAMLRAALESEDLPAIGGGDALEGYAILPPSRAKEIAAGVVEEVIFPGLERYGIDTSHTWRPRC